VQAGHRPADEADGGALAGPPRQPHGNAVLRVAWGHLGTLLGAATQLTPRIRARTPSKGKKESLWFYFAANPLIRGGDRYAMHYSITPPNPDGKQPWIRILTPQGTERTPLDKKTKGDEIEK
jgi:hypothetical protein